MTEPIKPGEGGDGGNNPNPNPNPNEPKPGDNQNPNGGGDDKNVPITRFNEVNDKYQKLLKDEEKRKADAKKAEEEALTKNKEFESLATKRGEELEQVKGQLQEVKIQNAVERAAIKLGAVDTEAVYKLLDKSNIKVTDDGKIEGVDEAVKSLIEAKPFLKGEGGQSPSTIGSGSNPDDSAGTKKYPLSWVREKWSDISWTRAKHEDLGGLTGEEFLNKIEDEGRIDQNA